MQQSKRFYGSALTVAALIAFAGFVWPTMYIYDIQGYTVIRAHRMTGYAEITGPGRGWEPLHQWNPPLPAVRPQPPSNDPAIKLIQSAEKDLAASAEAIGRATMHFEAFAIEKRSLRAEESGQNLPVHFQLAKNKVQSASTQLEEARRTLEKAKAARK